MATNEQLPYAIYKYPQQSGAISYQMAPKYNTPSGSTEVTDINEVSDYIKKLRAMGEYIPGRSRETGITFDTQGLAKTTEQMLADFIASSNSGYVLTPEGTFTTQKAIDEQAANKAAAQAGTMKNIGTMEAPLYVPSISPAQTLATNPTQYAQQYGATGVPGIAGSGTSTDPNRQALAALQPTGQTYVVQLGDTLSQIAERLGVPMSSITGYRSGNPDLIYPNEVLSIGGGQLPAPPPAMPPTPSPLPGTTGTGVGGGATGGGGDSQAILDAMKNLLNGGTTEGTTGGGDYRQQMMDLITLLQTQNTAYTSALAGMQSPTEMYNAYQSQLGIPAAQQAVTSAQQAALGTQGLVKKTEDLITQLEGDINKRIEGLSANQPILEAQRRRQLASEQKPLSAQLAEQQRLLGQQNIVTQSAQAGLTPLQQQLSQMMNLGQTEQERAATLAKAPLEFTQSLMGTISDLAQYQSPQEKMATQLAQEQLMKTLGLGGYYESPAGGETTADLTEYQYAQQQGYKGSFADWQTKMSNLKATTTDPTEGVTGANYNTRLNQEITNAYSGKYGTTGGREAVYNILVREFPNMADQLTKDIYGEGGVGARLPNDWEKNIKSGTGSTTTMVMPDGSVISF